MARGPASELWTLGLSTFLTLCCLSSCLQVSTASHLNIAVTLQSFLAVSALELFSHLLTAAATAPVLGLGALGLVWSLSKLLYL